MYVSRRAVIVVLGYDVGQSWGVDWGPVGSIGIIFQLALGCRSFFLSNPAISSRNEVISLCGDTPVDRV